MDASSVFRARRTRETPPSSSPPRATRSRSIARARVRTTDESRDGTRRALFRLVNETNDESRDEMVEESIPLKFELFRVASFFVLRLALLRARVIGHHVGKIFARGGGALLGDGALVRGANRRLVL